MNRGCFMNRPEDYITKRKKYIAERYGEKKSCQDDYRGGRIFKDNDCHPSSTTGDNDHITPIDVVKKKYPGLSEEEHRKLANNRHNFAMTNSKLNRSKKNLENHEYLIRQAKKGKPEDLNTTKNMLLKEVDSKTVMFAEAMPMYGSKFAVGAKDALSFDGAGVMVMAQATTNLIQVATGEKNVEDAAKDVTMFAVNVAITGGTTRVISDIANSMITNSSNEVLQNLLSSQNQIVQVVAIANLVGDSMISLVEGNITPDQFFIEIYEKGASMALTELGKLVVKTGGAAAPAAIATLTAMMVTFACIQVHQKVSEILDKAEAERKAWGKKYRALNQLAIEAKAEIQYQKESLEKQVYSQFDNWDKEFAKGFNKILTAALEENNAEGIADGLDDILRVFGKKVRFDSYDEFEAVFFDEDFVLEM